MYKETVLLSVFLFFSSFIFSSPCKGDGSRQTRAQERSIHFSSGCKKQATKKVDVSKKKLDSIEKLTIKISPCSDADNYVVITKKDSHQDEASQNMILALLVSDLMSTGTDIGGDVFLQQALLDQFSDEHLCNQMQDLCSGLSIKK